MPLYTFAPAKTLRDVLDAWGLVHDCYRDQGYTAEHPTGIYTHARAIGPQSLVAVARDAAGRVAGTMTMIMDTPGVGIPLDDVYGPDLDAIRARGMKLAEVGLHAGDPPEWFGRREAGLYRLVVRWGLHAGGTVLVAGINPKHLTFFTALGFEPIVNEVKEYRAANGAPVLPVWCSVERLGTDERCRFARKVLGDEIPESEYADRYPFPADEVTACPALAAWAG